MCNLETKKLAKFSGVYFQIMKPKNDLRIIPPAPIFIQLPPPIFSHCVYIQHFIAKILYYIYFSICIIWFKNRYILLPTLGFYYNEFIFSEILFFFLILKNYGISSSDILLFRQWKETTCNILFEKRIQYCNFFLVCAISIRPFYFTLIGPITIGKKVELVFIFFNHDGGPKLFTSNW